MLPYTMHGQMMHVYMCAYAYIYIYIYIYIYKLVSGTLCLYVYMCLFTCVSSDRVTTPKHTVCFAGHRWRVTLPLTQCGTRRRFARA